MLREKPDSLININVMFLSTSLSSWFRTPFPSKKAIHTKEYVLCRPKTTRRTSAVALAVNQKNLAVFDEPLTPDVVFHNASTTMQGLEAYKQFLSMYITAFPDLQFTVEDMIAEGDTVVARCTTRGTHQGILMGIPPTGKQVKTTLIFIDRIVNGKAVENGPTVTTWVYCNNSAYPNDGIGQGVISLTHFHLRGEELGWSEVAEFFLIAIRGSA